MAVLNTHVDSSLRRKLWLGDINVGVTGTWSGDTWLSGRESTGQAGDVGSVPGQRRFPGEGNSYPLRYFCLRNAMDRGAWWATVHRVPKRVRHDFAVKTTTTWSPSRGGGWNSRVGKAWVSDSIGGHSQRWGRRLGDGQTPKMPRHGSLFFSAVEVLV